MEAGPRERQLGYHDEQEYDRAFNGLKYFPILFRRHADLGEVQDNRLAFLDGGVTFDISLVYLDGEVLIPEATLPLRVTRPDYIAAVDRALRQVEALCTIGVICVYREHGTQDHKSSTIGTIAEIRQYRRLGDGSINVVTRGQQRFRLRRRWIDTEGAPCGEIQIIEEDLPLRTPREAVGYLTPLKNLSAINAINSDDSQVSVTERRLHSSALVSFHKSDLCGESTSSDNEKPKISPSLCYNNRRVCLRAYWPNWVYEMHDSYCLAKRLSDMWELMGGTPSMQAFVREPGLLSFRAANNIPVLESVRLELLQINGISYRLRREIILLDNFDQIKCGRCQTLIAKRRDMFLRERGPPKVDRKSYVRRPDMPPMNLYKASGLTQTGLSSEKYSWFRGYASATASCINCLDRMGWLLTATHEELQPQSFWTID